MKSQSVKTSRRKWNKIETAVVFLLCHGTICLPNLCIEEQLKRTHERQKHCDEREKDSRDDS